MKRSDPGASSSLERGLTILELLVQRDSMRLSEVAVALRVSVPTAFRDLAVLKARRYVEHSHADRSYRLGPALKTLTPESSIVSLARLAGPALTDLQKTTGETVNLAQFLGGRVIYAAILEGKYAMRMSAAVGQQAPAHATSIGKALLSRLSLDEARAVAGNEPYTSFTSRTITRWNDLEAELKRTAARGYAEDDEETEPHVACIASAILGRDGYPVGAISISGLGARMPRATRPQLGRAVKRWCEGISSQLGADAHRRPVKAR